MAALRAENPTDNVISFPAKAGEKRIRKSSEGISSDEKSKAEILNPSSNISPISHPIISPPRTEHTRARKTRLPHDEQRSPEDIAILVLDLSDRELKRCFPKAWNEHQTLKGKTNRKSSRDTLHPGFAKFRDFLRSIGPAPGPSYTVDKIVSIDPEYGPGKCRWADKKTQARNRSTNKRLDWMGQRLTCAEWAERSGINYRTLLSRVNAGWTVERIFGDAPERRFRTPIAPSHQPPAPPSVQPVAPVPSFSSDGWPVTLEASRDFETGWTHARARALKVPRAQPLSKNLFGAWVIGSQIADLGMRIADAGCMDLLGSGRDSLAPHDLAYLEEQAAGQGIDMAHYYYLKSINDAFVAAHLDDAERWATRSPYAPPVPSVRASALQQLRHDIKTRPQYNPVDVYKVFVENERRPRSG